ncbi:MAG: DUF4838 domain-containing protein [Kiritimatiellae bacterium]|nr:DUF4838 domain-containing protein [Kiritimatiellia bacterium]
MSDKHKATFAALAAFTVLAASGGFKIGNEDRVVIYGDSITAAVGSQTYPRYVETYIRCVYPDWKGEAWNGGLSGDQAGNMKRFRRECLPLEPTVVTFNMGMNDSGTGPGFARSISRYVTNVTAIAAELRAKLPKARLVLCSAIPYETTARFTHSDKTAALERFARAERDLAAELGVDFIDVNRAYAEMLGYANSARFGVTLFSDDGIHPGVMGGHFMMAVSFIEGLGADPFLASAEIDAAAAKAVSAKGVEIGAVEKTSAGVSFTRRLARSPFPAVRLLAKQELVYNDRAMYGTFRIGERLNRDTVKITGLAPGNYDVKIDGAVYGTYAGWELARGVNFGEFCSSPDFERACGLSDAVGEKQCAQTALMHAELAKKPDEKRIAECRARLAAASAEIAKWTHPETRRVEIVRTDREFDCWNRDNDTVLLSPARGQLTDWRAFSTTARLVARGDGRFTGRYTVAVRNCGERERRAELCAPEGFSPVGRVFTLAPREKVEVTFDYDLPADAEPPTMRMKHYRTDLSDMASLATLPFLLDRKLPFKPDRRGVRSASVPLRLESDTERVRWNGAADLSGTLNLRHEKGRLHVAIDVRDQDHVNGFTGDRVGWDDSFSFALGRERYTLALTKNGAVMLPTNKTGVANFEVTRDAAECVTRYRLDFPYEANTNAVSMSASVFDRESNQNCRFLRWNGELRFGWGVEIADWGHPTAVVVDNGHRMLSTFFTNYIALINGTLMPVVSNRAAAAGRPVVELKIGAVRRGKGDNDFIYRQSYRIFTSGRDLVIQSPDPVGLGYGVAGFFQEIMGCRFYTTDFEKIPFVKTIAFGRLDHYAKPSFQMRGGVWGIPPPGSGKWGMWYFKNRCGGLPYTSVNTSHSFGGWLGKAGGKAPGEVFKEHPEWFSMSAGGKRFFDWNYGVCGSNRELAGRLADAMIKEIDSRLERAAKRGVKPAPADYYLGIAQGDGFSRCYCPECRRLVREQNSEAAPQILLFNRALDIVTRKHPGATVCTYAYFQTLAAPVSMPIHSNIYVTVVSSGYSTNQAGDQFNGIEESPANRHYAKALRDWSAKMPGRVSTYHWDGVDSGNSEYSEWPNVISHAQDIKYWRRCGVGCAQKAGGPRPNWGWLTHWLWYNLMWNADQDEWKMTDEFLRDYYGPRAGKVLSEYFRYMEEVRKTAGYGCPTVRWSSWAPILIDKVFTAEVRKRMDSLMDRAVAAARGEKDPQYLPRVVEAKTTTIDQIYLSASQNEPFSVVTDKETGKPWVVHGTDYKNAGRVRRLGQHAYDNGRYFDRRERRAWAVESAGSEAIALKDGDLEAVVAPWLSGQIVSLKKGGREIFAQAGSSAGYKDLLTGRSKAWETVTNAPEGVAATHTIICAVEWHVSYDDHWFDRNVSLKDGKLRIERRYSQPDCTRRVRLSKNARFSSSWSLAMPSAADAAVGVVGGGVKQAVSLAGADKAVVSGKNTRRPAERIGADCQNPLFDVLEEVAASGDVDLPLAAGAAGPLTIAYTRGDGLAVEIETEAKGWTSVKVKPDAANSRVVIELVSDKFDGEKNPQRLEMQLPVQTLTVKGEVRKRLAGGTQTKPPAGELKIKKIDDNHAVNLADGAEMIRIPAGKFLRGSKTGPDDEQPQREIELSEYWIYKEPVTLLMFTNNLARTNPGAKFSPMWGQGMMLDPKTPAERYPVLVGWYEAEAYARSVGGELPTEAQWEKAARGDKDDRVYPWGDKWDGSKAVGWERTVENFVDGMFPSGSCPAGASPYGLMDMAGNNFEWVRDWYSHDYYKKCPAKDPKGPAKGVNKVLRGGDSNYSEDYHRCSARYLCDPARRDCVKITFRVVVENVNKK